MIGSKLLVQVLCMVGAVMASAVTASPSTFRATGGGATGHVLYVVLPTPLATCKCKASVAFNPTDGVILCPGMAPQPIAVQVIWQTPTPAKGNCTYVAPDGDGQPTCDQVTNSKCGADIEPLDVTLYNCWSGGKWVKATGLQSGGWFWFTNDSGIEFDPNLEADCVKQGGTQYGMYTIEFASSSGGTAEATFRIILSCENCSIQQ